MLTHRAARADDLDALVNLYAAYDTAEFGQPELEADDLTAMLSGDDGEGLVLVRGDRVVGHATLAGSGEAESAVDPLLPDARTRHDELLSWVRERAAARGVRRLEHWAGTRADGAARVLAAAGYEHVRTAWDMERALSVGLAEPVWPEGTQVPAFDRERHARAVWALVTRAFAGRFGSHSRPFEQWAHLALRPGTDVVCAMRDGALAGAAVTRPRAERGHVDLLAVDPQHQGCGLGLALLHEAFRRDAAAGRPATTLGVDGENASARALYEKTGMTVTREFRRWERDV